MKGLLRSCVSPLCSSVDKSCVRPSQYCFATELLANSDCSRNLRCCSRDRKDRFDLIIFGRFFIVGNPGQIEMIHGVACLFEHRCNFQDSKRRKYPLIEQEWGRRSDEADSGHGTIVHDLMALCLHF